MQHGDDEREADMDMTKYATSVAAGAAAGAFGTLAMDFLWFTRSRDSGSDVTFDDFEFGGDTDSFDDAGAPAAVGRTVADSVGADIPDAAADTTDDAVHWATGVGWGIGGSLLATATGLESIAAGLVSGAAAFGAAYTVLPALGVYDPIWEYDGKTLSKDVSAHALYGAATGVALAAISAVGGAIRHRRALGAAAVLAGGLRYAR